MASRSSKKKKYSNSELPTQWSNWEWISDRGCWSRYRLDRHEGDYEFEERAPETGQSVTISSFQEPRSSEAPHYDPAQDTTYDEPSQAAFETSPVTPDYTFEDTTTAFGNLDLNKGKEPDTEEYVAPLSDAYPASVAPSVAPVMHTVLPNENTEWNIARNSSIYDAQYARNPGATSSQQPLNPYSNQYSAPSPPYPYDNQYDAPSSQQSSYPYQGWQNSTDNITDQSSFTQQGKNYIGPSTQRLEEPLDSRFKVYHSSEFKVGKVFKILWAEPYGVNGTQLTEPVQSRSQKYREEFVHKIRIFVVITLFRGHCLCLPIQTYGRQGTTKFGAQAEHHAIIYSDKPITYEGEKLTKKAIKVDLSNPRGKLDPASRINYAKVYTIEHNVKVFFIGRVNPNYRHQILADYQNTVGLAPYDDLQGGEGSSR